jgi:uncharacterized protein (TIGR02001 family)
VLRSALASLTAFAATASIAQVSANVSLASDDRFRGVSLTQGHLAAQLDVGYDHASGLYAGAFASNVEFDPVVGQELQWIGYAGYARRLQSGWSVDAGAAFADFSNDADYRYWELHAGVASEAVSARVYYSPNYFGVSIHTLYAEFNGSYRLTERLKAIGHAGLLQAFAGATDQVGGDHPHADFLAGLEVRLEPFSLQVARVFSDGASSIYPVNANHTHGVLTVRVSAGF